MDLNAVKKPEVSWWDVFWGFVGWLIAAYWNNFPVFFNYYARYVGFFACAELGLLSIVFTGDRGAAYSYCMVMNEYDWPVNVDLTALR